MRNGPDITVPTTTTTTTTTTRRPPQTTTVEPEAGYDKCRDGRLDAITMATDGEAYAFRGQCSLMCVRASMRAYITAYIYDYHYISVIYQRGNKSIIICFVVILQGLDCCTDNLTIV